MKTNLLNLILSLSILSGATLAARADALDDLAGKWSVSKTNNDGISFKQVIDFKKDKFIFRLVGADDKVGLYAEGKVKVDKAGDLLVLKLTDIQYGKSKDDLQPADDDRTDVYVLRDGKLILASNFDKERDGQAPTTETYEKIVEKTAGNSK